MWVCEDQTDRSVQVPFDEALGTFAKLLVLQAIRDDARVAEGIQLATDAFRQRVGDLTAGERARFRELFWENLAQSPDVLTRLESVFLEARRHGRLRCWVCAHAPRLRTNR
ncbi:MAG TPA: hypothetical protein VJS92_18420 [Candidatus Polarisedimenticolaceae bacterium]|nr:hypothetical protein [Candidatus Polarisedimenticolaceae bacterium]